MNLNFNRSVLGASLLSLSIVFVFYYVMLRTDPLSLKAMLKR